MGAAKQRALLAILLIHANQAISVERLIELIWSGEAPDTADHSLQVYVSQLRKVLEPKHHGGTPYEVLVSQAAADASGGDEFLFDEIGQVALKGVAGTVHLLRAQLSSRPRDRA